MRHPTDEHSHLAGAFLARPDDPSSGLAGAFVARPDDTGSGLAGALVARANDPRCGLAGAYLALADDPAPAPSQRSAPRALCALVAGVVLALAAPLAWASPAPRDQPAATAAGKAAGVEVDDDDLEGA
jgi:hypothetical protein